MNNGLVIKCVLGGQVQQKIKKELRRLKKKFLSMHFAKQLPPFSNSVFSGAFTSRHIKDVSQKQARKGEREPLRGRQEATWLHRKWPHPSL